jgi:HEAT repeat protein
LGDPRAIEPLIALFTRSTRTDICGETIRVLASFDDPRVVQPLLTVLHGARYDASLCARALDKFDDPRILPEFSRIFRQEVKITDLKSTVASLLARRGDPEAFAYLLTRINNTDPIFSNYMLLGQTGDARALEPLLEAATKPDSYGNVAIRGLQALMELNPDPEVQQRGGTALLSLLGKAKYHSDFMILKPLITGKDPRAIEPLLRIFETGAWSSEQTAEALAEIGGPRVLDAFLDRLQAGPIPQRAVAARMLGRLDDPRVTPALAAAVRLGPTPVRLQAAESLGRLKARDAIEPLINVLGKDSSFRVRTAAATALAEITGQAFGVNAAQWREWWAGLHG